MAARMEAETSMRVIHGLCLHQHRLLRSSLDHEVLAAPEAAIEVREGRRRDLRGRIIKNRFSTSRGRVGVLRLIHARINEARRLLDRITVMVSGLVTDTARHLRTYHLKLFNDHRETHGSKTFPTFRLPNNSKPSSDSRINDLRLDRLLQREEVLRLTTLKSRLYIPSSKKRTATAAASGTFLLSRLLIRPMPAATQYP